MTEFETQGNYFDVNSFVDLLGVEATNGQALQPNVDSFFTNDVLGQFTPEHSSPLVGLGSPASEGHSSMNERSDSSSDEMEAPSFSFPEQVQTLQDIVVDFPALSQLQQGMFGPPAIPQLTPESVNSPANASKDDDSKGTKRRRKPAEKTAESEEKAVGLDEAKLLEFDSKQMEEYMQNLAASRTLAPSEEKNLKKIRRLIKNREYAQSSRDKKKSQLDDLQKQLNQTKQELTAVQTRNQQLENENLALRAQMAKVSLLLRTDPVIRDRMAARAKPSAPKATPPSEPVPSASSNIQVTFPEATLPAPSSPSSFFSIGLPSATTVVSGFSLFIILFSFALFFSNNAQPFVPGSLQSPASGLPTANIYNTGRTLLEAAHVLAFGTEMEKKHWVDALPLGFKDFLIRHNLYVTPTDDVAMEMDPLLAKFLEDSQCEENEKKEGDLNPKCKVAKTVTVAQQ